jgi:hypothetical protein
VATYGLQGGIRISIMNHALEERGEPRWVVLSDFTRRASAGTRGAVSYERCSDIEGSLRSSASVCYIAHLTFSIMPRFVIQLLFLFFGAMVCAGAQTGAVRGFVRDASGANVAGAVVTLESDSHHASVTTGPNGRFAFQPVPEGVGSLDVRAPGFADAHKTWKSLTEVDVDLMIVLQPQVASEQVLVSAERTEVRLSETPGSAVLLSTTDVQAAPALRVDDVLRQVPGFSLFRRSGSRTANASSMGVSLRGLGGTAASRALVLRGSTGIASQGSQSHRLKWCGEVSRIFMAAPHSAASFRF